MTHDARSYAMGCLWFCPLIMKSSRDDACFVLDRGRMSGLPVLEVMSAIMRSTPPTEWGDSSAIPNCVYESFVAIRDRIHKACSAEDWPGGAHESIASLFWTCAQWMLHGKNPMLDVLPTTAKTEGVQ